MSKTLSLWLPNPISIKIKQIEVPQSALFLIVSVGELSLYAASILVQVVLNLEIASSEFTHLG